MVCWWIRNLCHLYLSNFTCINDFWIGWLEKKFEKIKNNGILWMWRSGEKNKCSRRSWFYKFAKQRLSSRRHHHCSWKHQNAMRRHPTHWLFNCQRSYAHRWKHSSHQEPTSKCEPRKLRPRRRQKLHAVFRNRSDPDTRPGQRAGDGRGHPDQLHHNEGVAHQIHFVPEAKQVQFPCRLHEVRWRAGVDRIVRVLGHSSQITEVPEHERSHFQSAWSDNNYCSTGFTSSHEYWSRVCAVEIENS